MINSTDPSAARYSAEIEAAAPTLGIETAKMVMGDLPQTRQAIEAFARVPNGGLIALPNTTAIAQRDLIIGLAAEHRLPAIYPVRITRPAAG